MIAWWWTLACTGTSPPEPVTEAPEPTEVEAPAPAPAAAPAPAFFVDLSTLPDPGTQVWGFALGSSRASFQQACRGAGFGVDRYDWTKESPQVQAYVAAGRASKCDGLPAGTPLGPVAGVSAVFDEQDRMIGLTAFLGMDPNDVESVLAEKYPQVVAGDNQILHVVDELATDDQILSVTLFRSVAPGAQSSLTFLSARGGGAR